MSAPFYFCLIMKKLLTLIILSMISFNAIHAEVTQNLKIYFSEYVDGASAPKIYVTDDNAQYDVPLGMIVRSEGVVWPDLSRFYELGMQGVTDRVIADFISADDRKHSKLKISFTNFPYEINTIQWNVMNDLLSGSVTNFFKSYNVTTKCIPVSGSGFTYTEERWSMNIFAHQITFSQGDIPWKDGAALNGLTSFEISEEVYTKVGIGGWTLPDMEEPELNDNVRTFIKAGWNGLIGSDSNITDSDDSNWAFKVKFTLPEITAATYTYDNVNKVHLQPDNNVYVGEQNVHAVKGYISAHAGAVDPTYDPTDQSDFHFEYFIQNSNESNFAIGRYTGAITKATVAGDYPVIVKLMRGQREVCSYIQIINVIDPNANTYTVTLDHNNGVGDPEQITVVYNQPMPENIGLVAPTRTGYEFTGYSRDGIFYYDANLKSVRNFDKQEDYTLYANWKARTTTVTLNPQGGTNGTAQVTATYEKAMPTGENIVAPTRDGYTFEGYYSSANGKGTQYYNADMTSKRSWNKDANSTTLYAYWKPIAVSSVSLSEKNVTLCVSDTKTITAFVTPTTAYNKGVVWSSSDSNVATVNENGVVTGVGAGTAIIKATAADGKGAYAECEVTVGYNTVTLIDASENYSNEAEAMVGTLKYTRTFNNTAWQALYIPFSMKYDDWKRDFEVAYVNNIRQLDKNDDGLVDETIMDIVKIKSGSLIPNTPYLIKAKTVGEKTLSVKNATLYETKENSIDCRTTIAEYTFTGTYKAIPASTLIANNYFAMGGGALIITDGNSGLNSFRWYMKIEPRGPMYNASYEAKAITINVVGEEETTGVEELRMTNHLFMI